jgi:hypothetical protein
MCLVIYTHTTTGSTTATLILHLVAVEQKRVESQGVMYYSVLTTPLSIQLI